MNFCEMACDILVKTSDGDKLSPEHLKLLEMAVNGFLNEKGETKFKELHETVTAGKYRKPFLHGIEHMTIDHEGYVYWKGQHVEHYDFPFAFSKDGKTEALRLANRCQHLEKKGVEVSVTTAIWNWEKYK